MPASEFVFTNCQQQVNPIQDPTIKSNSSGSNNKMSGENDTSPEARWKHLRENGTKVLVDLSSNELINEKPLWLDNERFARAKATIDRFYIGVQYSSLTGLMLVLQLPDALESLLATGNSKNIPSLFKRYLSTILHVISWYEDDIFDPSTKGYRSIRQVRSMHRRIQTLMNEHFRVKDREGKEHLWVTQYDVAVTQFAFIGLAMLFPRKSALIAAKHEDLELINYYWRVLGYLMGLKDEFNGCQFDSYDDIRKFNELIFEHEYLEKFRQQPCPMGLEMSKAICKALQYYLPFVTFNSLAHWWSDCFSFNGYELQPRSSKDNFFLFTTQLSFNKLLRNDLILRLSTSYHKKLFKRRLLKREKVHKKLVDKHESCPFFHSERMNYPEKLPKETQRDDSQHQQQQPTTENNDCKMINPEAKHRVSALANQTLRCFSETGDCNTQLAT